jgi:Amt family ammonium transporter
LTDRSIEYRLSSTTLALTTHGVRFDGDPYFSGNRVTVTGTIAGLATITSASGFVGPASALVIGLIGRAACYVVVSIVKQRFEIDDSLDVFAVHGIGGATGILLTAICVGAALGGAGLPELRSMSYQFAVQLLGVIAILVWSVIASYAIVIVVKATVGLRVGRGEGTRPDDTR